MNELRGHGMSLSDENNGQDASSINDRIPSKLFPGYIGELLFRDVLGAKIPKQLDLLAFFYPDLIITEEPAETIMKEEAFFDDKDLMIHAEKRNDSFYAGGSKRVSQITSRLIGTSKGGQEKERQTAIRIRERIARELTVQHYPIAMLLNYWKGILNELEEEDLKLFTALVSVYIDNVTDRYINHPDESGAEAFPFRDDVFQAYQERLINAWNNASLECVIVWLLLGALLRNEISGVVLRFACDFCFFSEAASLPDMEAYTESFYEGDDLDKRFPGIEWFCDRCGARLDHQPGFDDHLRVWKCTKCGYKNPIEINEIYDSDEAWEAKRPPVDPEDFYRALKRRTDELDEESKKKEQHLSLN